MVVGARRAGLSISETAYLLGFSRTTILSEDVRQRMREANQSSETPRPPKPESRKPDAAAGGHSSAEMPEELRKRFELEQALLREELARITRREKESVGEDVNPVVLQERARTKEEQKNVQNLAKQLARKDAELKHLAAFYKEQLQLLENKNKDYYQQSAQMYNEAAAKASSNINFFCETLSLSTLISPSTVQPPGSRERITKDTRHQGVALLVLCQGAAGHGKTVVSAQTLIKSLDASSE
ncbi:MICOS complex subunit MIC25 [Silurus meridionalis]|nr:MICOS complex subunit MIC25 [Silurus meridionalis]